MTNRILILGAKGMLGGALRKVYPDATAWDREEADVLQLESFRAKVRALAPAAIINCVAFNDVDGAEERRDAAHALNTAFPGRLAALACDMDVPLVHYSSNYVFDGVKGAYAEDDRPNPLSVYGASKLEGEREVARNASRYYVLRTAVIFGPKGESEVSKRSFIEMMLDLSTRRDTISAVVDEVNSITYARDLARATQLLLDGRLPCGLYHAVNSGEASWYDLACEIFRITGRSVTVTPAPASSFPRKARRPSRAVLCNTKFPPLRPWQDAVREFLRGFD